MPHSYPVVVAFRQGKCQIPYELQAGGYAPRTPISSRPLARPPGGSKNVILNEKHVFVDVTDVHPSQKARKPIFQKWVLHDLTYMTDTQ